MHNFLYHSLVEVFSWVEKMAQGLTNEVLALVSALKCGFQIKMESMVWRKREPTGEIYTPLFVVLHMLIDLTGNNAVYLYRNVDIHVP